ncbi:MAG TPA: HD domain-containing phosphohydrolase [Candidatus Humimicrobiaceae bacterium]
MDLQYSLYIIIFFLGIVALIVIYFLLRNKRTPGFRIGLLLATAWETIINSIRDFIIVLDNENRMLYLNPSARNIFKYQNKDFIGKPINTILTDYYDYLNNDAESLELKTDITIKNKDEKKYYNMIISPIIYRKKKLIGKVIVLRDITKQTLINESLDFRIKFEGLITTLSTKFIKLLPDEMDNGMNHTLKEVGKFSGSDKSYIYLLSDNGSMVKKTHEWCAEGIKSRIKKLEKINVKNMSWCLKKLESFEPVYIQDVSKLGPEAKKEREFLESQRIKSIIVIPIICGGALTGFLGFESIKVKKIWTKNYITLLKLLGEIIANALERKEAEKEIKYLSLKDKLTGLYNRAYFEEEIKRLNTKRQLPLSIIMGDVNGLKIINDTFGHREGDKLLKKIARIIKSCCREEDIIARWGGDEFSILLPKTIEDDAEEILNRIRDVCFKTGDQKIPVSVSLGTSTKKVHDYDIRMTVKEAEDWMYRRKLLERRSISSSIIASLERTLQEKSYETEEHAVRLKDMALVLGQSLKLTENKLNELILLSALHDIGKIAIPDDILMKKGKLTRKEWGIVKRHPEIGFNITASSPQLVPIADAVLSHHEWWNGNGYPRGLRGEDIPLVSRIISIVDSYDVMTHDRAYRKAISKEKAMEELERFAGTQFDPTLVNIFLQSLNRL